MVIGTMRAEESAIFDRMAGYHQFHAEETREPYGSFEVFFVAPNYRECDNGEGCPNLLAPGWYWFACFPGCLPDGEPSGPFARSDLAHEDADEWSPEYDEDHSRQDHDDSR